MIDLSEIRTIITGSDVFAVAFRLFPERLLIDTRYDGDDPDGPCALPMVAIVDPVETMEERFFWLGQHRPSLGAPQRFNFFFWPHSVRFLEESGIWEAVRERVISIGFPGAAATCDAAMADLVERERRATIEAIRGERYHTVWSAAGEREG